MNEKKMLSGTINSDDTHFFNTQLFILSSNISTGQRDVETIYGPGFFYSVSTNTKHLEKVGALMDVTYLATLRAL